MDVFNLVRTHLAAGAPAPTRAKRVLDYTLHGRAFHREGLRNACEVARHFAHRLGLSAGVRAALLAIFEQWNGTGPSGTRGAGIPLIVRIETPDRHYAVGLHAHADRPSDDYRAARHQAMTPMFAYLKDGCGLSPDDAYVVVSACVDLECGGPAGAVALASVPLAVLDPRGRP